MDRRNFLTASAISPILSTSNSWGSSEGILTDKGLNWNYCDWFNPTNIEDLRKAVHECFIYLNIKHNGKMGRAAGTTENGTPYTTYVAGGIKNEGDPLPIKTANPTTALRLWFEKLDQDARDSGKGIVWRIYPEVGRDHNPDHYLIRTRVAFE